MYGRRRFDLGVLVALSSFFFVWGAGDSARTTRL